MRSGQIAPVVLSSFLAVPERLAPQIWSMVFAIWLSPIFSLRYFFFSLSERFQLVWA